MSNKKVGSALAPQPPGRLRSFKPPRDLTLGSSVKRERKKYQPNLNVTRSLVGVTVRKEPQEEGRNTAAGGEATVCCKQEPVLKSESEPIFDGNVPRAACFKRTPSRVKEEEEEEEEETTDTDTLFPHLAPCAPYLFNRTINWEREELAQHELLQCDNVNTELMPDTAHAPVVLPITTSGYKLDEIKREIDILKHEFQVKEQEKPNGIQEQIKQEKKFNEADTEQHQLRKRKTGIGKKEKEEIPTDWNETTVASAFQSERPKMFFLQAEDGLVGKIQLLRSGRARLVTLDGRKFHVVLGIQNACREDVVSADLDPTTHTGDMINLGPSECRVMILPQASSLRS